MQLTKAPARVVAFINQKGGVGKTSMAINVAGQFAQNGFRTLIVDLDPQGNVASRLGFRGKEGFDDRGAGLLSALVEGGPLPIIQGVRENLDIVVSGREMRALDSILITSVSRGNPSLQFYALRDCLLPLLDDYDMIFIDCPPGNVMIQQIALCASRWLILPSAAGNDGSLGLEGVAEDIAAIATFNPKLDTLGVPLFNIPSNMKGKTNTVLEKTRARVIDSVGDESLLFNAFIVGNVKAAGELEDYSLLASEAAELKTSANWTRRFAADVTDEELEVIRFSEVHPKIAQGYQDLAEEISTRITELEAENV